MNDNVKNVLNEIYEIDPDLYVGLLDKNLDEQSLRKVLKKLSKPVSSVACKMCAVNNTVQSGCKAKLVQEYNTLVSEDLDETVGRVSINNTWVNFDISIVRILKALLIVGVSKNEELAIKCREIINKILILGSSSSYVTERDVIKRLNLEKGKFKGIEKELIDGIKEVLL